MTPTVRTFRAPDSASALAAVKAALGPEALIISTRAVDGGLFRRPEVEVTAATPTPAPARRPYRAASDAASPEPAPRPHDDALEREVRLLRRSVEDTRRALSVVTQEARAGREMQLPPAATQVWARLVGRGVEPELAEAFVRTSLSTNRPDPAAILAAVKDLVAERLVPCRAPWLLDGPQTVAVIGPTGVGKTTTLAKIAARALLETSRRVAFVTLDTYRVGATEQLARYGEIMGVPVLVARDRAELLRAAERVRDVDLLLVDTAGRSSPDDVARQAALVRTLPKVRIHLVVSAATGAHELAAVAERYRELSPDRLVLTKLDEASGPGGILSASARIGRPVACVADGQRVPEDLHAPTGPELVELIVGTEPAIHA